jgi:hypothetical protein
MYIGFAFGWEDEPVRAFIEQFIDCAAIRGTP